MLSSSLHSLIWGLQGAASAQPSTCIPAQASSLEPVCIQKLSWISPRDFAKLQVKPEFNKDHQNLPCFSFFQLSKLYFPKTCQPPSRPHAVSPRAGKTAAWGLQKTTGIYLHLHPPATHVLPARVLLCQEMKRLNVRLRGRAKYSHA